MPADKMQRQRFEVKYQVNEDTAVALREFFGAHLDLDENGVGKPDFSYPVHSLYLDSDDLRTYRMTINGDKNRFKLRIRFYNDQPDSPVFFEIKRRVDNCILKQRGGVRKTAVPGLLAGQLPAPEHLLSSESKALVAIQRFCELAQNLDARPKVHVAYQREAWEDRRGQDARVTIDRTVLGEPEPTTRFSTNLTHPVQPFGQKVIVELKFTNRFPDWFRRMVEHFNLAQCGAAKYCECVELIGADKLDARLHSGTGADVQPPGPQGGPTHLNNLLSVLRAGLAPPPPSCGRAMPH